MLHFTPWKYLVILGISLASILFTVPNFVSPTILQGLPSWMQMRMPLGLDLQGGSHLLLQMNVDELRREWLESISGDVRQTLRNERIGYTGLATTREEVRVTIRQPDQFDAAYTKLRALARPTSN